MKFNESWETIKSWQSVEMETIFSDFLGTLIAIIIAALWVQSIWSGFWKFGCWIRKNIFLNWHGWVRFFDRSAMVYSLGASGRWINFRIKSINFVEKIRIMDEYLFLIWHFWYIESRNPDEMIDVASRTDYRIRYPKYFANRLVKCLNCLRKWIGNLIYKKFVVSYLM